MQGHYAWLRRRVAVLARLGTGTFAIVEKLWKTGDFLGGNLGTGGGGSGGFVNGDVAFGQPCS